MRKFLPIMKLSWLTIAVQITAAQLSKVIEELYTLAKKFDADVVHCGKNYSADEILPTDKNSLKVHSLAEGTLSTEPSLLSRNLAERVKLFVEHRINWVTVCNFVRRNFLMHHDINFPTISVGEDVPYTLKLLWESKNFLCVPNLVYIYRIRKNSQSDVNSDVYKRIKHRVKSVFLGIEYLDKYMSGIDFFVQRPDFRCAVLDFFKGLQSYDVLPMYEQFQPFQIEGLIRRELNEVKDKTALTAFLFSRMNVFNVQLNRQSLMIRQMDAYIKQLQAQLKSLQG